MRSNFRHIGRGARRVGRAGGRLLGLAGVAGLAYYLLEKNKQKQSGEPVIIDTKADFEDEQSQSSDNNGDSGSF
jgi:uncharacterized membrane protein YebE (DUF533 family)